MTETLQRVCSGRWALTGDLDAKRVAVLVESGWQLLLDSQEQEITVDLSGINTCDSSALALLLCWLQRAHDHGLALAFCDLSDKLIALARMSDVESMLSLQPPS